MRLSGLAVLGWVAVILCTSSCELSELSDPIVVSDVEDEFKIIPWERLSPEGRTFEFRLETLAVQDCKSASISHQLNINGNQISLSIREIDAPKDCDPGTDPALGVANAGELSPRFYELTIDLKNTVFNEGQLSVFGDRYVIDMESTEGFEIANRELRRVPEQTIWGYVTYPKNEDQGLAEDLLSDIDSISQTRDFTSGHYGYFRINDNSTNKVTIAGHPNTLNLKQFIYQYEENLDDLATLVEGYRNQYGEQLDIRLYTWTGEEL